MNLKEIEPQPGAQFEFFQSEADILIFGGAAGSGKTHALLLEALWHHDNPKYNAVIFRKNANQVRNPGGLWDSSAEIYMQFGGIPKQSVLEWDFPSGAKIKFAHLDHETDKFSWQGSQMCVSKGTKILMKGESYKKIEEILIDDEIVTLQGTSKISRTFPSKIKKCVKVKCGNAHQIHPIDHKFLSIFGWTSWDDLKHLFGNNFLPIQHHDLCKLQQSVLSKFCDSFSTFYEKFLGHSRILELTQSFQDQSLNEALISFLTNNQNCSLMFDGEHLEAQQPVKLTVPLVLHEQFSHLTLEKQVLTDEKIFSVEGHCDKLQDILQLLKCCNYSVQELLLLVSQLIFGILQYDLKNPYKEHFEKFLTFCESWLCRISLGEILSFQDQFYNNYYLLSRAISDVLLQLESSNFQGHCSIYNGLCDEQLRLILEISQSCLLQLSDVVQQVFLFLKRWDDLHIFLKHNQICHIEYDHPYKKEALISSELVKFSLCEISLEKEFEVFDIEVETNNHYITESGIINKNCYIGYDELTHFSWSQFVYMLSRNRSMCGIKPYIRATCNPDSESWVRRFIDWWINPDTGYPIPERSGKLRWFTVQGDDTIWTDTKEELLEKYPDSFPKSVSFIGATIYDNQILLESNPEYLANLKALPRFEREQLLEGNWNIRPTSGMFFQRVFFEVVQAIPKGTQAVRYWDRAATKETGQNDPDYTVGLKLEKDKEGLFYVTDIVRLRGTPLTVQTAIKNTASQDGPLVRIGIEQDPGQAGVAEVDHLVRQLQGYQVKTYKVQKDKITRALPVSSQSEAGNIKILMSKWNEDFFRELENFPEGAHDDIVDSLSGAFNMFSESKYDISKLARW